MDKLTFCNNYLYSRGQVIFIFVDKLSSSLWTSYLHLCGQVISLMMSVLSQKICVLIVPICRNGNNDRWIELTCQ
jgi:hypothetical protein